jgi:hypothetical protein
LALLAEIKDPTKATAVFPDKRSADSGSITTAVDCLNALGLQLASIIKPRRYGSRRSPGRQRSVWHEVLQIWHDVQTANSVFKNSLNRKFSLASSGKSVALVGAARASMRGRLRDRHGTLVRVAMDAAASGGIMPARRKRGSVRRSRVVLAPRPWRYVGGLFRRQRGQERPLPRGEHV